MTSEKETVFFSKGINAGIVGIVVILILLLIFMVPTTTPVEKTDKKMAVPAPLNESVKSARPVVDLYVMSFCPYGTQAETIMQPVRDLLGSKADIRIRYITDATGATMDSVSSLHGMTEVKEDAFQACLAKASPDLSWQYLRQFNAQCYPTWQNATALEECRRNVTATLNIDQGTTGSCVTGNEGFMLLKRDATMAAVNDASASPTLIVNGKKYTGPRNPEAYKQAICSSFDSPPAECATVLSTASSSVSGKCG